MPGPRATAFGRCLLPLRPRCSPRRRLRDTAPVREGDKLHKSCRPAPERRCFVLSVPTPAPRSRDKPAATAHRAPPAWAGHPPRAAPQCRPPCAARRALTPALPRGNLKHGAPNRGFRQIDREKARGPSRPFRRGLRRRPPHTSPQADVQAPGACPTDAAAGRRAEGTSRGTGFGARARPSRDPSRRAGGVPSWAWPNLGSGDSGRRAAREPRVSGAAPRASSPASGLFSAPRKRETPWDPRVPADRKVTSAGQGARARGGVWMGSVRVFPAVRKRRGRGEEAADAGCLPRLPAPLCRGFGGSAELRRGHTPRDRAEKANLVLTPLPGCGGMGHRSTLGLLRGNSLLHPGVGSGWGQHLATAANGVSLWMST